MTLKKASRLAKRNRFKFNHNKNNRGFSLLELLVSGLLLVGVVVGFIRVFTPARGFTVTEARLSFEINLDRQKLEDLRQEVRQDRWDSTSSLLKPTTTKYTIPISILKDKKLSVAEHIVKHIKETYELNYHEIATLMKRDDRTIWTLYNRATKKSQ